MRYLAKCSTCFFSLKWKLLFANLQRIFVKWNIFGYSPRVAIKKDVCTIAEVKLESNIPIFGNLTHLHFWLKSLSFYAARTKKDREPKFCAWDNYMNWNLLQKMQQIGPRFLWEVLTGLISGWWLENPSRCSPYCSNSVLNLNSEGGAKIYTMSRWLMACYIECDRIWYRSWPRLWCSNEWVVPSNKPLWKVKHFVTQKLCKSSHKTLILKQEISFLIIASQIYT